MERHKPRVLLHWGHLSESPRATTLTFIFHSGTRPKREEYSGSAEAGLKGQAIKKKMFLSLWNSWGDSETFGAKIMDMWVVTSTTLLKGEIFSMINRVLKNFHKEKNLTFNVWEGQIFIKIMYEPQEFSVFLCLSAGERVTNSVGLLNHLSNSWLGGPRKGWPVSKLSRERKRSKKVHYTL